MKFLRNAADAFIRLLRLFTFKHEGQKRSPAPAQPPPRPYPTLFLQQWKQSDRPPPLLWKECQPRTRDIFKAELTCSNGHSVSLRSHTISGDGSVYPSVVCLTPGCDFHEIVRLEGWSLGRL